MSLAWVLLDGFHELVEVNGVPLDRDGHLLCYLAYLVTTEACSVKLIVETLSELVLIGLSINRAVVSAQELGELVVLLLLRGQSKEHVATVHHATRDYLSRLHARD